MRDLKNESANEFENSVIDYPIESDTGGIFDEQVEAETETNAEIAAQYAAFDGFDKLADLLRTSYRQDYPGEVDVSQPFSINTINDVRVLDEDTDVPYSSRTVQMSDDISVEGIFPQFPAVYELFTGDEGVGLTRYEHNQMCNELLAEAINEDPELHDFFSQQEIEAISNGKLPEKYTWHHEPEVGYFSLVERSIHDANRHTGGYALWGAPEDVNPTSDESMDQQ